MVGLLNAPRGTRLYHRLQQEDRLLGDSEGEYTNFSTNFIPKMGTHQLREGYKYLITSIYTPRNFYSRLITFLRNYCPPDNKGSRIKSYHIKAFFHSIWSLGIWGEERFYYWKVLFWTLLRRPELLRWCVELAMKGYHFRKVFQSQFENYKVQSDCQPLEGLQSEEDRPSYGKENKREKGNFLIRISAKRLPMCNMDDDSFDPENCMKIAPAIERRILHSYQSIVLSEESKKGILDLGNSAMMLVSLHKSHFDYIAICGKIFLEGLPCPRTVAGSNLLIGWRRWSIKHLTGIDMVKWGAIPLERNSSVSHNLLNLCSRIETILRRNTPILAFPEIEIVSNGNGNSIKTGRAYSGRIRRFASALFSPAINVAKEGKKVYVVPIAVSYDFVAEDGYFGSLTKADKMKKSEKMFHAFAGNLYYTFLESHFFYKMYSLGKGKVYIDTGQPILVEPGASKKELAQLAQEEAARCYRVTMPALVAYAINKGVTSRDDLQKSVERYGTMLKEVNANFQPPANLRESIEGALESLAQRKIISNHQRISVRAPKIISYYANTIAHYFEDT
jgi:hypothetical protein